VADDADLGEGGAGGGGAEGAEGGGRVKPAEGEHLCIFWIGAGCGLDSGESDASEN
jgi:hypothetical protein